MVEITRVRQVDGGSRIIYAQDEQHAARARQLIRDNPAMIDYLRGVDGLKITARDTRETTAY